MQRIFIKKFEDGEKKKANIIPPAYIIIKTIRKGKTTTTTQASSEVSNVANSNAKPLVNKLLSTEKDEFKRKYIDYKAV